MKKYQLSNYKIVSSGKWQSSGYNFDKVMTNLTIRSGIIKRNVVRETKIRFQVALLLQIKEKFAFHRLKK